MERRTTSAVAAALITTALVGLGVGLIGTGLRLTLVNWTLLGATVATAATTIWWLARRAGRRDGVTRVLLVAACSAAAITVLGPLLQLLADLPDGLGFQEVPPAAQPDLAAALGVVGSWFWVPSGFALTTFGLLLFPDGRLPSRRWRWAGMAAVVGMVLIAANEVAITWPTSDVAYTEAENTAFALGYPLTLLASAAGLVSLVVRYRRSDGVVRHQIRWLTVGGVILLASLFLTPGEQGSGQVVATAGVAAFFAAYGVAVLKYRLFDVDVVINRAMVFAALAALITGVYVAVVVGIGSLIGRGDEPDLLLSILATAIVALLFEPARHHLQRWANRFVYGPRATPFEVLSQLTERLSSARDRRETLREIALLLREGTGADVAVIWLRQGEQFVPQIVDATSESALEPVVELNAIPGDVTEVVVYDGETLGAVSIRKPAGEAATDPDRDLVRDVARSTGLVLFNLRLDERLAARAAELRESRRRIVAAQDAARRQLERDLHDGAQQQVVALKVKLGIARTMCEREGLAEHGARAAALADRTQRAIDSLRQVARGIYPPLLASEGLSTAIRSLSAVLTTPTDFELDDIGRHHEEIEASVYFSVLEALRNVDQHAGAERATVQVQLRGADLVFTVADDGRGTDLSTTTAGSGLQTIRDRLDALGGELSIASSPSAGTTVMGAVPAHDVPLHPSPTAVAVTAPEGER